MNFARFLNPRFILALTLAIVIPFISYNLILSPKPQDVLSEKTAIDKQSQSLSSNLPTTNSPRFAGKAGYPLPTTSPTPSPQPTKATYTIAVIGDSMVDTMGERLEYLDEALKSRYPATRFNLYNYGIGGQNVAQGLARFDKPFSYQTRNFPPLASLGADVIIVASFAYNPFPQHNRDQHWLTLSQLVDLAQNSAESVYVLAEIAPLASGFGNGPGGINWPPDLAKNQSTHIVEQLENAVAISHAKGIPLINSFEKSKINGQFGESLYVSSHDGIHPSVEGHYLMAGLIAATIKLP